MERHYTTPGGYERMQKHLQDTRDRFFAVCADNEDANGSGDSSVWHDNFAYEENQRQMQRLSAQVISIEKTICNLVVYEPPKHQHEKVQLGSCVRIAMNDKEQEYFIAGYLDGSLEDGRISYTTPLGKKLLGAEEDDVLYLKINGKELEIEVLEINPPTSPNHN